MPKKGSRGIATWAIAAALFSKRYLADAKRRRRHRGEKMYEIRKKGKLMRRSAQIASANKIGGGKGGRRNKV